MKRRARRHDQRRAEEVELVRPVVPRQPAQQRQRHHHRDHAERDVHPEDHRPVQVFGDGAAERRPKRAGGGVDHREIAVVLAALPGRGDVAQHHHAGRGQAAAAEAVQHAAEDEHENVGRQRADQRAQHVQRDRDQQRDAAAVDVADLAVQRGDRGVGDQVGGDQPRQVVHLAEFAADGRQRARQDGGVERAHEHRQQHAEHHEHGLAVGEGSLVDGGPASMDEFDPPAVGVERAIGTARSLSRWGKVGVRGLGALDRP